MFCIYAKWRLSREYYAKISDVSTREGGFSALKGEVQTDGAFETENIEQMLHFEGSGGIIKASGNCKNTL